LEACGGGGGVVMFYGVQVNDVDELFLSSHLLHFLQSAFAHLFEMTQLAGIQGRALRPRSVRFLLPTPVTI
jgi:hypothetical protein